MNIAEKSWKWHWITLTILLLFGVISINLFFSLHKIRVHQHENAILSSAILHMEVDAAIFHLRTDEIAAGEEGVAIKDAIAGMGRAIALTNSILRGETIDAEEGSVAGVVATLKLQQQLEELKSLLVKFKEL